MNKSAFAIVRKGYDPTQVDARLGELETKNRGQIESLQKRVTLLEQDKAGLERRLDDYKAKEQALADALVQAQSMVAQAKDYAAHLAETEQNRLQLFCDKWTAYARARMDENTPDMCATLQAMQQEYAAQVAAALQQNLFCHVDAMYPEYLAEQERIRGVTNGAVHIDDLLNKLRS